MAALALLSACSGVVRPVPVAELAGPAGAEREPTGSAGGSRGANPAAGRASVPTSVRVAWRSEVGPSLAGPLRLEGPALLAGTGDGAVVALDAASGARYWRRRLTGTIPGVEPAGRWLYAVSAPAGQVHGLRLRDGGREWTRAAGETRVAPAAADGAVFVAVAGAVAALEGRTGRELWRAHLPGRAALPPRVDGAGLLVATTADTLYRLDRADGRVAWRAPLAATPSAPPALRGDTLYLPLFNGELVAILATTGALLARAAPDAPALARPVLGEDGAVYLLTRTATLWRFAPGLRGGEKIAELGGAATGSLALAGDRLLVGRLDGVLVALRTDGTELWRERFDDSIVAPAVAHGGAIFVPLLRGAIVKLEGGG